MRYGFNSYRYSQRTATMIYVNKGNVIYTAADFND